VGLSRAGAGVAQPRGGGRYEPAARGTWLRAWSVAALVYHLFIPIAIVIAFSFNDRGPFNLTWEGFTLDHWSSPFAVEGLQEALTNSLLIAALSTALAVVLGTFMALALVRHRFKAARSPTSSSSCRWRRPRWSSAPRCWASFITMGLATGFATILIAHTMFNVAYVVVTIKARPAGHGHAHRGGRRRPGRERVDDVRKVTLPLIAPGVAASALLALRAVGRRLRDLELHRRADRDVPVFIWGAARQGVPAEVNVLATMLLLAVLLLMGLNVLWQRRLARNDARITEPARAAVQPGLAQ
jgi:spermidine/putrescine transport system permease protein